MDNEKNYPPELLNQLKSADKGVSVRGGLTEAGTRILTAAGSFPATFNTNDLIIRIWEQTGRVEKRSCLQSSYASLIRGGWLKRVEHGRYQVAKKLDSEGKQASASPKPTPPIPDDQVTRICAECGDVIDLTGRIGKLEQNGRAFCSAQCLKEFRRSGL